MCGKGWFWVHAAQQAQDLNVAEPIADSETRGVKLKRLRVRSWHKTNVQPLAVLGPLTGALPTFGAECRFTGAFQTLRWHAAKVGS